MTDVHILSNFFLFAQHLRVLRCLWLTWFLSGLLHSEPHVHKHFSPTHRFIDRFSSAASTLWTSWTSVSPSGLIRTALAKVLLTLLLRRQGFPPWFNFPRGPCGRWRLGSGRAAMFEQPCAPRPPSWCQSAGLHWQKDQDPSCVRWRFDAALSSAQRGDRSALSPAGTAAAVKNLQRGKEGRISETKSSCFHSP